MLRFEWSEEKNQKNRKKHGVWFEEACHVFDDLRAIMFFDKDHSKDEDRFIMLGKSASNRVLIVIYCERREGSVIRIISARKATKREQRVYEKGI
jgi:uncharacterized DUF497 family protein